MNFAEKRKAQLGIKSLGDKKRSGAVTDTLDSSKFVHGPTEFDCLHTPWMRGEMMAITADSGVGKTEMVLMSMAEVLRNNPESIAVFVSLEMTDNTLASRWFAMTQDDPTLADRLYIVSRYDEDGKAKIIDMNWISNELTKHREVVGDIAIFAIDHFLLIGDNDLSSLNQIAVKAKELCVSLNAFGIMLAQVSKGAGQKGEVPLDSDAVYGSSSLKWIASNMMQIHRPIKRYESEAKISVIGYGYTKIREPHKDDQLQVGQNKLLKYNLDSRDFTRMDNAEYTIFKTYYNELLVARGLEQKSQAFEYDITKEVMGKNGAVVVIKEIFSGDVPDDL